MAKQATHLSIRVARAATLAAVIIACPLVLLRASPRRRSPRAGPFMQATAGPLVALDQLSARILPAVAVVRGGLPLQ